MTIREDIKTQFEAHITEQEKAARLVAGSAYNAIPFDIEVFWMNGTQDVLRIDSFPEDFHGFFAAVQRKANVSKDFGPFDKRVWTVNPDHIQRFRKVA